MKILDTDIIIAILRKHEEALEKLTQVQESDDEIATTVFNEQEVLYGPVKYKLQEQIESAKAFFNEINILIYERICIPNTVEIIIDLENRGLPIGTMDELIAGICLTYSAAIVTRNTDHFSRIPKLKVEKW